MNKILVADNIEMNKSILHEIFSSQYEIIETSGSELVFKFLTQYKSSISIILINEGIARNFTKEMVQTLTNLKIFENVPVILILNEGSYHRMKVKDIEMPYCDVTASPVNPQVIKNRVANLVELYSHKKELEALVERQTAKILAQNKALKIQQRTINTINNDMLDTLSTVIEYRDVESGRHIHRIKKFTEVMLRALAVKYPKYNMTEERINLIASASSLHDIGKIAIPDSILLSPRRLTYDEFNIMKEHTVKGCDLLNQLDSVERNEYFTYCYDICRYHHEKFDGKGYPDGLAGNQIPIWAQVVSVADCYDALTSERPYKAAFSHEQAVEMIRTGACGAFSDEMMDCFSEVLPEFQKLAKEYADVNHADSSVKNGSERKINEEQQDTTNDLYRKMDRGELIRTIEQQKLEMKETRRKDNEILNRVSDFVFQFDLKKDMAEERKGGFYELFGYTPKNYSESVMLFTGLCPDEYHSKVSRTLRIDNIYDEIRKGNDKIVLECPMKLDDNVYCPVRLTAVPMCDDDEINSIFISIQKLVYGVSMDGSDEMRTNRDSMTGLLNFVGLRMEIDDYLSHSGKNGKHLLMLIDIDGFRTINRQTGYRFGNEILKDIANILKSQFTDSNIIGRVEDDNFIVFLKDCSGYEQNLAAVDSVFHSLHKSYTFNGKTFPEITACIGVASYPANGRNFEELFFNSSKAVDIAKINGKDMYLFYNNNMRSSWEISVGKKEELARTSEDSLRFESYFDPILDSVNEKVVSYEVIEGSERFGKDIDFDEIYSALHNTGNITAFSLDSLRRVFNVIHKMEKDGLDLPNISVMTIFKGEDCDVIIRALEELLVYYPINCSNICINITQDMLTSMDMRQVNELTEFLSGKGFEIGVYNVGLESINTKCFTNRLFGRITFANSFLDEVSNGIIPMEILVYLIDCFTGLGAKTYMPMNADSDVIRQLRAKTDVVFGIHGNEMMDEFTFREAVKSNVSRTDIPVLGHEKSSLVLNDRLYDEILEQTRSFIFEWSPRLDSVKFSGSFEKLYGYTPESYDFIKNIRSNPMLHSDDIKKFLEKMNFARSEGADAECLVRIYNQPDDEYIWNRAHFVAVRNAAGIPVKIMAVCADVSGESDDSNSGSDARKDRTDYITHLYNRTATENKIKNYLYDDGAAGVHALMIAEICNFEAMEEALGKSFANAVLKETADNVRELFRDSDIIGRISGAQFVIFVKGMSNIDKITEKAEHICAIMRRKFETAEGDISIFGKLGVSMYPSGGRSYEELYSTAMKSLYYAKHNITGDLIFDSNITNAKRLNGGSDK